MKKLRYLLFCILISTSASVSAQGWGKWFAIGPNGTKEQCDNKCKEVGGNFSGQFIAITDGNYGECGQPPRNTWGRNAPKGGNACCYCQAR